MGFFKSRESLFRTNRQTKSLWEVDSPMKISWSKGVMSYFKFPLLYFLHVVVFIILFLLLLLNLLLLLLLFPLLHLFPLILFPLLFLLIFLLLPPPYSSYSFSESSSSSFFSSASLSSYYFSLKLSEMEMIITKPLLKNFQNILKTDRPTDRQRPI